MTRKGRIDHVVNFLHDEHHLIFSFRFIVIFLLMTALSSCSHHVSKMDGPPNFYVDETKIPNAVPKPEPLAKYGNMSSYKVFGKRYYTMKSSQHYQAVGVASWYGTKFHARNTSSGEPYNILGMTAAHKTLPLPTYVEVTNLRNDRKIIVKVNDRGPFESNRLIDLSYVAAKKLGMLGHGTTLVRVKAIDPYHYGHDNIIAAHTLSRPMIAHNQAAASSPSHLFFKPDATVYLQVGAFRNKSHAKQLQQRLIALLSAPVTVSNPSANKNLYRVQVGPIKNKSAINKIYSQLKVLGIKPNKIYV